MADKEVGRGINAARFAISTGIIWMSAFGFGRAVSDKDVGMGLVSFYLFCVGVYLYRRYVK